MPFGEAELEEFHGLAPKEQLELLDSLDTETMDAFATEYDAWAKKRTSGPGFTSTRATDIPDPPVKLSGGGEMDPAPPAIRSKAPLVEPILPEQTWGERAAEALNPVVERVRTNPVVSDFMQLTDAAESAIDPYVEKARRAARPYVNNKMYQAINGMGQLANAAPFLREGLARTATTVNDILEPLVTGTENSEAVNAYIRRRIGYPMLPTVDVPLPSSLVYTPQQMQEMRANGEVVPGHVDAPIDPLKTVAQGLVSPGNLVPLVGPVRKLTTAFKFTRMAKTAPQVAKVLDVVTSSAVEGAIGGVIDGALDTESTINQNVIGGLVVGPVIGAGGHLAGNALSSAASKAGKQFRRFVSLGKDGVEAFANDLERVAKDAKNAFAGNEPVEGLRWMDINDKAASGELVVIDGQLHFVMWNKGANGELVVDISNVHVDGPNGPTVDVPSVENKAMLKGIRPDSVGASTAAKGLLGDDPEFIFSRARADEETRLRRAKDERSVGEQAVVEPQAAEPAPATKKPRKPRAKKSAGPAQGRKKKKKVRVISEAEDGTVQVDTVEADAPVPEDGRLKPIAGDPVRFTPHGSKSEALGEVVEVMDDGSYRIEDVHGEGHFVRPENVTRVTEVTEADVKRAQEPPKAPEPVEATPPPSTAGSTNGSHRPVSQGVLTWTKDEVTGGVRASTSYADDPPEAKNIHIRIERPANGAPGRRLTIYWPDAAPTTTHVPDVGYGKKLARKLLNADAAKRPLFRKNAVSRYIAYAEQLSRKYSREHLVAVSEKGTQVMYAVGNSYSVYMPVFDRPDMRVTHNHPPDLARMAADLGLSMADVIVAIQRGAIEIRAVEADGVWILNPKKVSKKLLNEVKVAQTSYEMLLSGGLDPKNRARLLSKVNAAMEAIRKRSKFIPYDSPEGAKIAENIHDALKDVVDEAGPGDASALRTGQFEALDGPTTAAETPAAKADEAAPEAKVEPVEDTAPAAPSKPEEIPTPEALAQARKDALIVREALRKPTTGQRRAKLYRLLNLFLGNGQIGMFKVADGLQYRFVKTRLQGAKNVQSLGSTYERALSRAMAKGTLFGKAALDDYTNLMVGKLGKRINDWVDGKATVDDLRAEFPEEWAKVGDFVVKGRERVRANSKRLYDLLHTTLKDKGIEDIDAYVLDLERRIADGEISAKAAGTEYLKVLKMADDEEAWTNYAALLHLGRLMPDAWKKFIPQDTVEKLMLKLRQLADEGKAEGDPDFDVDIDEKALYATALDIIEGEWNPAAKGAKGTAATRNLRQRLKMSPEIREAIGPLRSGPMRLIYSLGVQEWLLANLDVWNTVIDTSPRLVSPTRSLDFRTEIPNNPALYGNAAGKFIANDAVELINLTPPEDMHPFMRFITSLSGVEKRNQIAMGAADTWITNFFGNVYFSGLAGVQAFNPDHIRLHRTAWRALARDVFVNDPLPSGKVPGKIFNKGRTENGFSAKEWAKEKVLGNQQYKDLRADDSWLADIVHEAQRMGADTPGEAGATFGPGKKQERLRRALAMEALNGPEGESMWDIARRVRKTMKRLSDSGQYTVDELAYAYDMIDRVWKLGAYLVIRERELSKGRPLNVAATVAAQRVNDYFPSYANMGKVVDFAARLPFALNHYLRFGSEVTRIHAMLVARMFDDPLVLARLGGLWAGYKTMSMLSSYVTELIGGPTREEQADMLNERTDAHKRAVPHVLFLPLPEKSDGSPWAINMSPYNPVSRVGAEIAEDSPAKLLPTLRKNINPGNVAYEAMGRPLLEGSLLQGPVEDALNRYGANIQQFDREPHIGDRRWQDHLVKDFRGRYLPQALNRPLERFGREGLLGEAPAWVPDAAKHFWGPKKAVRDQMNAARRRADMSPEDLVAQTVGLRTVILGNRNSIPGMKADAEGRYRLMDAAESLRSGVLMPGDAEDIDRRVNASIEEMMKAIEGFDSRSESSARAEESRRSKNKQGKKK